MFNRRKIKQLTELVASLEGKTNYQATQAAFDKAKHDRQLEADKAQYAREDEVFTAEAEREDRANALEAAMGIHGYFDDESNFGTPESVLDVVISAQMIYDFLSGDTFFDYDHLLYDTDDDDEGPSGLNEEVAPEVHTHH